MLTRARFHFHNQISSAWQTGIAFGLPMLIYFLTLAPTVYNLDSAELTTAAASGGLMRATGYPLYLAVGYWWSKIPFGDVGYRMNLFSAVMGAVTIALTERILSRWHVSGWAKFGALGLLASTPFFWGLSLIAEVYTLHTAIMAALILALLRWGETPTPWRFVGVGVLAGLGLSHHAATVLLVPGCVFYVLVKAPRQALAPRAILAALAGLALGLIPYLYLPLRYAAQPVFNYAGSYDASLTFHPVNLQTWAGLWWLVSGQAFSGQMLAYHGSELLHEVRGFTLQLGQAFLGLGIGPGLLGLVVLWRRNWREAAFLSLMFAGNTFFYIDYRVIDKDTMFLPSFLIWALWIGIGYDVLLNWVRQNNPKPAPTWAINLLQGLMVGVVLLAVGWNWRLVDLSHDWSARQRGEAILRQVQPNALVFGWWDTIPVVQYLQLVEGQRPDVQAINRFFIAPPDMEKIILQEVDHRSIYIDDPPQSILAQAETRPAGPLQQLLSPKFFPLSRR